jgi:glycosyltransferase involved in cell wall biosynthesis
MPEVMGDAGILLPPRDAQSWAEAIRQVATNADLRADLRARGLRQATQFSWTRAATETRALYTEVYARRR